MSYPCVPLSGGDEDFTAPDCSVLAVTRSIECHAEHGFIWVEFVFSHDGCNMRVMMLHFNDRCVQCAPRPLRRQVAGMGINGHYLWFNLIHRLVLTDHPFKGLEGLEVLHVADVLTDPSSFSICETERVLQLTADGEHC